MRLFRLAVALLFGLSSLPGMAAASPIDPAKHQEKILLDTATFMNSLKSVGQMIGYMKASASADDREFFETVDRAVMEQPVAKTTIDVNKKIIYFKGLKPIQVLDLAAGKYSYEDRPFTFNRSLSAEKSMAQLEEIFFPQRSALLQLLLPEAQAMSSQQKGLMMGVFGAMGVMGMLSCFSQNQTKAEGQAQPQSQPQPQQQNPNGNCMMGFAGLLGLFIAMGIKTDEAKEVKCTVTSAGVRTAQIIGPGGRVLSSTQGLPGQYSTAPAIAGPVNYGPQLMQICGNQVALGNINQALAAPPILPPAPAMRAYVNAPPARPPSAAKIQSVKPQGREPAESGSARFLEPGAGAR